MTQLTARLQNEQPRLFADVATLLGSALTYTAGSNNTVAAGQIIQTQAEGFAYQVAPEAATDQHVTTAGGAKLYVSEAGGASEFRQFGGRPVRLEPTRAEIRHRRIGGQVYDVVTIRNPKPGTLSARVVDDMAIGTGQSSRVTMRSFAVAKSIPALMNFSAFRNADGSPGFDSPTIVPNSFLIAGGIAYTDWSSSTNTARVQGFTVQRDGTMVQRTRGVGTASDYVADGAVFGCSWGCWLVWNGIDVSAAATFMGSDISARNILGQRANGDWVLIVIQGATGVSGANIGQAAAICLAEGCARAFLIEGGGSTQLWWENCYALPSSDGQYTRERTQQSFLAIDCPLDTYDTGLVQFDLLPGFDLYQGIGISVRQIGAITHAQIGVSGSFSDVPVAVTPDISNSIRRFRPIGENAMVRGFLSGTAGTPGGFFLGNAFSLRTLSGGSPVYLTGSTSWTVLHSVSNT